MRLVSCVRTPDLHTGASGFQCMSVGVVSVWLLLCWLGGAFSTHVCLRRIIASAPQRCLERRSPPPFSAYVLLRRQQPQQK